MPDQPPNIVLMVSDELAAGVLPAYGGDVDTENLDRLAEEGTVFESAYCNSPVCTPSRYSMLTGRYPWSIGAYHNQSPVPSDVENLASMLSSRDYETVGIGKMHFKGTEQMWGYERRPYGDFGGLSHQPDPLATAPRLSYVKDAGAADIEESQMQDVLVGDLACDFLDKRDGERPFFLHLSFNFPHYPLRPPERLFSKYYPTRADLPEWGTAPDPEHSWMQERRDVYRVLLGEGSYTDEEIARARAAYYACTELVDEQVGRVLAKLDRHGLAEDTVVIFTADHGEMLGEQGTWEKNCFYEQSVRVPLITRYPGMFDGGQRISDIVELVDLFPTVEVVTRPDTEQDHPRDLDGESLTHLIEGQPSRRKDFAISELAPTYVRGLARMVRLGKWKYVAYDNASPSLFDLDTDPAERHDLGLSGSDAVPDPRLEELSETDFERVARESESSELAVHPSYADMTPNQYMSESGQLVDAEDFYGDVRWVRPTRSDVPGVHRVRPHTPNSG